MNSSKRNINAKKPEYLKFSATERAKIRNAMIADRPAKFSKEEAEKIVQFPEDISKLESIIAGSPLYFDNDKLTEVTLRQGEYAPKLTAELTKRKAFDKLIVILNHYKGTPRFQHCVSEIENALDRENDRDEILNGLYQKMKQTEKGDNFTKYMLSKPEKASRDLVNYQHLLGIDDEELKKSLNGKSLLMIGGGVGSIKESLKEKGIDCQVSNIEPLLGEDTCNNSDHAIRKNFYDVDVDDLEKFDEVWSANNSLPTYALDTEQVSIFYKNALKTVKNGGKLRILPVYGFRDYITPAMRLNRIPVNNASKKYLNKLMKRPDLFEIVEFETPPEKTLFGKEVSMQGVVIKLIGTPKDTQDFIENL